MSNRKVIELLLQLKSAKAHDKNYIKVKPHLVHHHLEWILFQMVSVKSLRFVDTWRSGYCYLNKAECNLNQSKDDSFVERAAKNNS